MKGMFITLEGTEGAGKSTQRELLVEHLRRNGVPVVQTREPGGTPLAEEIRGVMLAPRDEPVEPIVELALMFSARAQHLARVIRPALEAGKVVICDRYVDSTYAYQGYGRMFPLAKIDEMFRLTCDSQLPDLTLNLQISSQTSADRLRATRNQLDRMELSDRAFFARVNSGFNERAKADPARIKTINAEQPMEEVTRQVIRTVDSVLLAGGYDRVWDYLRRA